MKQTLKILFFLLFSITLFGQNNTLFDSYKIPTYSYHSLNVYGQDFFSYLRNNYLEKRQQVEEFEVGAGLIERYVIQSPMRTRRVLGIFEYNYNSHNNRYKEWNGSERVYEDHIEESSIGILGVMANNSWYYNNERGISINVDPGLIYEYDLRNSTKTQIIDIPLSAGYGRVIGVKSMVQARIISDEIDAGLSEESIVKLTEIIDQYNGGYYDAIYRDNAEIEYYKAIAELTNKPEQTKKIEQILSSPVYKTSERFIGWQVKGGFNFTYLDEQSWKKENPGIKYSTATDLFASFEYARPFDFDKQLLASLTYSTSLNDEDFRLPKLKFRAQFSIDHNYFWSTNAYTNYSIAITDKDRLPFVADDKNLTNFDFGIKSEMIIINSYSVYASLEYSKYEFMEAGFLQLSPLTKKRSTKESIEFHLGFNYYIL